MRRRLTRAWFWVFAGLGAAAALCGVGTYAVWSVLYGEAAEAASSLASEIQAARAEGLPIEPKDLIPAAALDPNRNAASEYEVVGRQLQTLLPDVEWRRDCFDVMRGRSDEVQRQRTRRLLSLAEPLLLRFAEASKRPLCAFRRDYSDPLQLELSEPGRLAAAALLFCAKAALGAQRGNVEAAEADLQAALRIAAHLAQDVFALSTLHAARIEANVHRTARQIVRDEPGSARKLAMALRTLDWEPPRYDLARLFRNELPIGVAICRRIKRPSDVNKLVSPRERRGGFWLPITDDLRRAWEARWIAYVRRTAPTIPNDPAEFAQAEEAVRRAMELERAKPGLSYSLNRLLVSTVFGTNVAIGRAHAEREITRAYLNLVGLLRTTGKLPDSLEPLGVRYRDPFDGKELRYRRTDSGFLLYSVDRDLTDDGGRQRRNRGETFDNAAEFP